MTNTDENQASLGELRYWIVELIEELKVHPFTQHDDFRAAWALAKKVEQLRRALDLPDLANIHQCEHGYWVDTSDPVFGTKSSLGFGYNATANLHHRDRLRKNLEAWLRYFDRHSGSDHSDSGDSPIEQDTTIKPRWDRGSGTLYFGSRVAKKLRVAQAQNVCLVLDSFQELDWPERIDDPLPQKDAIDPARRRSDTRDSLNKNLSPIRFTVLDGGFRWETV